jgi:4-alpha-glucanotransferase
VITVRLDHQLPAVPPGSLTLEDGGTVWIDGRLPADLPAGYHVLQPDVDTAPIPLVASPGRCPAPRPGRTWGWASQLYATRSRSSWGIGDLADLRRLAQWSTGLGGGITLINPLHASTPLAHQEPSPYFASSRCFLNPLYLRVEELPGAAGLERIGELASAGRALNAERTIDRDRVWALKSEALEVLHDAFTGDADFDRYCEQRGDALAGWATFCALAELHGLPFQDWPDGLDRRSGPAVAAFASSGAGAARIRYHQWLQWHLDRQLGEAGRAGGLMQDLAIGVAAGGADAWIWRDCFAPGMRVGAPPDEFNTLGQDWGLPPRRPCGPACATPGACASTT